MAALIGAAEGSVACCLSSGSRPSCVSALGSSLTLGTHEVHGWCCAADTGGDKAGVSKNLAGLIY